MWNIRGTLGNTIVKPGYPFLELNADNYRYACGFANSAHTKESIDGITRGKWDFFPFKHGTNAISTFNDILNESNALLDPCKNGDAEFLTFNEFGGIEPAASVLTESWEYCRVKISIEIYNLMYSVVSKKRKELWVTCENRMKILAVLYNKKDKSHEEQMSFDHIYKEFIVSLQKKAEYSAVVVDCVKHYRKNEDRTMYRWLHEVVPDILLDK